MFKGIFEYSDVYFNQLTQNDIKALNGYTVQFSEESGRLLVEANRTPKDGEDVAEITLTFKEGLENVTTTGVVLKVEELTDGKNEYDTPKLVTQVAVVPKADKTEETKDEQINTETTKDDQKNTETTKDDNKKDEAKIKSSGAAGIIRPGRGNIQVIIGTKVQFVADAFSKLCE